MGRYTNVITRICITGEHTKSKTFSPDFGLPNQHCAKTTPSDIFLNIPAFDKWNSLTSASRSFRSNVQFYKSLSLIHI